MIVIVMGSILQASQARVAVKMRDKQIKRQWLGLSAWVCMSWVWFHMMMRIQKHEYG